MTRTYRVTLAFDVDYTDDGELDCFVDDLRKRLESGTFVQDVVDALIGEAEDYRPVSGTITERMPAPEWGF